MQCSCGGIIQEKTTSETIRHYDCLIEIKDVPVLYCEECEMEFYNGSTAIRLAQLAKGAYENNQDNIRFI